MEDVENSALALPTEKRLRVSFEGARAIVRTHFYYATSLLIFVIVVYGFSHTLDKNLFHPAIKRPLILYVHSAVFFGWVLFFILQSQLVRLKSVKWHRKLGWVGAALGVSIPVLGVWTSISMTRFDILSLHDTNAAAHLIVPLWDMVAFSVSFYLALRWRMRPEFHRRLMFMASCGLTAAAFGRFPSQIFPHVFFYGAVDLLVCLGVVRDLFVEGRVHKVYLYGIPAMAVGQIAVMYANLHHWTPWMKIADAILKV